MRARVTPRSVLVQTDSPLVATKRVGIEDPLVTPADSFFSGELRLDGMSLD
jgi:hypothetical protein